MNPELNQDDINIEDFLFSCLDKENEDLNLTLDISEIFNKSLISTFDFYYYFEITSNNGGFDALPDTSGTEAAADNNLAYYALFLIYGLIPLFNGDSKCSELEGTITQVLSTCTVFLNSVKGANIPGILDAEPYIITIQKTFTDLENNLGAVCELYNL